MQNRTVWLRQRGRCREGEGEGFVANVIWVSFLFFLRVKLVTKLVVVLGYKLTQ